MELGNKGKNKDELLKAGNFHPLIINVLLSSVSQPLHKETQAYLVDQNNFNLDNQYWYLHLNYHDSQITVPKLISPAMISGWLLHKPFIGESLQSLLISRGYARLSTPYTRLLAPTDNDLTEHLTSATVRHFYGAKLAEDFKFSY